MEMLEVGGLRIAYERDGAGPPLVVLHGYVGDGPTTWRQRLGLEKPHVAGLSFGGALALALADLSPEEFVALPTMFSETTPPAAVDAFGASMLAFHPVGFRAMARASAENLRDVLPRVCNVEAPEAFNRAVRNFLRG